MARRLRRDLGTEAMAMSRGYHLRGYPEESARAAALALRADPGMCRTPQWLLLAAVRRMDPRLWRRADPLLEVLRRARNWLRKANMAYAGTAGGKRCLEG